MRLYEFKTDSYEYYAVIGVNTMEEAIKMYSENVCELEEHEFNLEPDEITNERLIQLYKNNLIESEFNESEIEEELIELKKELDPNLNKDTKSIIFLIDGSLI